MLTTALLGCGLVGAATPAAATAYTFPGNLPAGCSSSSTSGSSASYRCGPLALGANDTITINLGAPPSPPVTLSINGDLQIGSAQINAAGQASDLSLVVSGVLGAGSGAVLNANVTAGSVDNADGNATFGGSLASTGAGTITVGIGSRVSGAIRSAGAVTVGANASVTDVTSRAGAVTIGTSASVSGAISGPGAITLGANATVQGPVRSDEGAVTVGTSTQVNGPVAGYGAVTIGAGAQVNASVSSSHGAISLGAGSTVASVCCGAACDTSCASRTDGGALPPATPSGPHHVEIHHGSGTGLTCTASTVSVVACADAACSGAYTGGVSGSLTANLDSAAGAMSVAWPGGADFSIPGGSSAVDAQLQVTTPGSVVLGATNLSPAASNAVACNFGDPPCTFSAAAAGLVFSVPAHAADAPQALSVSAVRSADQASVCVPAFANVSKAVTFSCGYQNPASGALPVRIGTPGSAAALNASNSLGAACDATGASVSLAFNASGVASTTLQYADVGQVWLKARHAGGASGSSSGSSGSDTGLVMTGSASFIAAPAGFVFSALPTGGLMAGSAFGVTVSAVNSSGSATPNFGQERPAQTVTLSFVRTQPSGPGASDGVFSGALGAFSEGAASAANLVWSEVGRGDLNAALGASGYLGAGLNASGTTAGSGSGAGAGALGRFTPHHFDTAVTPACGSFSYAGQPFNVQVTALNGLTPPTPTANYDGSANTAPNFAQAVTLSDAPMLGVGSWSAGALGAAQFNAGVASATPTYTFSAKLTAAQTLNARASDADGVSSAGYVEGTTVLRSGRLRLSNAFGFASATLALPVQAQYWSGNAWVANNADGCSALPTAAISASGFLDSHGNPSAAWSIGATGFTLAGGSAVLNVAAPSPPGSFGAGSVDLALNLGHTAHDASCLGAHPLGSGAGLPWLRSQNGACNASGAGGAGSAGWDRDPSARATFGIFSPESQKTHDVRDRY